MARTGLIHHTERALKTSSSPRIVQYFLSAFLRGRQHRSSSEHTEAKKVIISTSRGKTLRQSLIHIVTILFCVSLISVHAYGGYLAPELGYNDARWSTANTLAVMQIAAKALVRNVPPANPTPFSDRVQIGTPDSCQYDHNHLSTRS